MDDQRWESEEEVRSAALEHIAAELGVEQATDYDALITALEETCRSLRDAERERDRLARRVEVLEADRVKIVRIAGGRTP